jgi:solute carrier family 25 phosphate transporter 3
VTDHQYANGLVSGFTKILTTEGIGSLYAGFIPILAKQVPYAIGQFTVNERCTEAIYNQMSPETKENLGAVQNLGITLGSGVVAGFAAAILSHVSGLQILGPLGFSLYNSFILSFLHSTNAYSLPIRSCRR